MVQGDPAHPGRSYEGELGQPHLLSQEIETPIGLKQRRISSVHFDNSLQSMTNLAPSHMP